MRIILGSISTRLLLSAVALSGATLLVAVGCGGGSSSSGGGGGGGSGGSSGDTGGDTSTGDTGGTNNTAGTSSKGGTGGESGALGDGGEAGEPSLPPAKNHSAVSFVAGGAISTSKHFKLIGAVGEAQGGTVSGKISKSLKHSFIPGVIAAASP